MPLICVLLKQDESLLIGDGIFDGKIKRGTEKGQFHLMSVIKATVDPPFNALLLGLK